MNNHLRRILDEGEALRKNRKQYSRRTFYGIVLCLGIFVFVSGIGAINSSMTTDAPPPTEDKNWSLLLVSSTQPLAKNFTVSLYQLPDARVDVRIAGALIRMIADAKQDGVTLNVCASYRDIKTQTGLYETEVSRYESRGYSRKDAEIVAARAVQPPGCSEHHTGLAIDFMATDANALDETFAQTPDYAWLSAHAAAYGFVERYPQDKQDLTGIKWEPWHFRYVGAEHVDAMQGLCLEEYITQNKGED